jgi:glycosyltransferase involved in cell wall biosynthesis
MKISIIIPVYNVEKYIERCLLSILRQTLQDFEIIVVNDATPDNSMQIVNRYASQDTRIIIAENTINMGLMWTRREGYKRASGDYIMFCDSDDYLPENSLELLYNHIVKTKADIVAGSFQAVSEKRSIYRRKEKLSYGTDSHAVHNSLLDNELSYNLWGKIYNRKLFIDSDYETFANQTVGEDSILFYQIVLKINKFDIIDDLVYFYFLNTDSITHTKIDNNRYKQSIFVWDYRCKYFDKQDIESNKLIKFKIDSLLSLLYSGYSLEMILKYTTLSNINLLFDFKILSYYYSGLWLYLNYIILNIRIFRKIICALELFAKRSMSNLFIGYLWQFYYNKIKGKQNTPISKLNFLIY